MPIPDFGEYISSKATLEEFADRISYIEKNLKYYLTGGIATENAREFAGWYIGKETIASRNMLVGLNSEVTDSNDLRIWAGSEGMHDSAFRVYEDGFVYMSHLLIRTQESGTRLELTGNQFIGYNAAGQQHGVTISAQTSNGGVIDFYRNGEWSGDISAINDPYSGYATISIYSSQDLTLDASSGSIYLYGNIPVINTINGTLSNHESRILALESAP